MSEENVFLLISILLFLPIATVVVAHSPTPSKVKIIASSNGDGKKALQHDLNDKKNLFYLYLQNFYHTLRLLKDFFEKVFFKPNWNGK